MLKTWDIQDKTGTLYINNDVLLDHLLQHIYWRENFLNNDDLFVWEHLNIASLLKNDVNSWRNHSGIEISAKVEEDECYCSPLDSSMEHGNSYNKAKSWMIAFDLLLHDCAVTYTYKAAKESNETYASIACQIWMYSRQLRQYMQTKDNQEKIQEIWKQAKTKYQIAKEEETA